jgi:hypothetical protein
MSRKNPQTTGSQSSSAKFASAAFSVHVKKRRLVDGRVHRMDRRRRTQVRSHTVSIGTWVLQQPGRPSRLQRHPELPLVLIFNRAV